MSEFMGPEFEPKEPIAYPVTIGQARDFMRKIIDEEFVWQQLAEIEHWGGHLHRAVLAIALINQPEDTPVDIIPLYVEAYVKQPKHWGKDDDPEMIRKFAQRSIERNAQEANRALDDSYDARRDHAIREIEAAFGYFQQSELTPAILTAFDEETNRRLRDKYFYSRNGLTGERYYPAEYPEYQDNPIPDPDHEL